MALSDESIYLVQFNRLKGTDNFIPILFEKKIINFVYLFSEVKETSEILTVLKGLIPEIESIENGAKVFEEAHIIRGIVKVKAGSYLERVDMVVDTNSRVIIRYHRLEEGFTPIDNVSDPELKEFKMVN